MVFLKASFSLSSTCLPAHSHDFSLTSAEARDGKRGLCLRDAKAASLGASSRVYTTCLGACLTNLTEAGRMIHAYACHKFGTSVQGQGESLGGAGLEQGVALHLGAFWAAGARLLEAPP